MRTIGIQFLKNSISVAYYKKDELIGKTINTEEVMSDSDYVTKLEQILSEMNLIKSESVKVVFSIPASLVETFTMKQLVPISKKIFLQSQKNNLLLGQIESVLEKSLNEYIIEYDIIDEKQLYNGKMLTAILCSKREDLVPFAVKLGNYKSLKPFAADSEFEGLRRIIDMMYSDIAIINFFKDERDLIGIYLYRGKKLIGIRYLYKNLYECDAIISEVERIIVYCRTFLRDFEVERWFVFGDNEFVDEILKDERVDEHELTRVSYAVAAGLALKEEFEKKKPKPKK